MPLPTDLITSSPPNPPKPAYDPIRETYSIPTQAPHPPPVPESSNPVVVTEDRSTRRNRQLSPETRYNIKQLRNKGYGIKKIARELNLPKTTVQGILRHLKVTNGSIEPKKRGGRPKTFTEEDREKMCKVATENEEMSISQIIEESGVNVSVHVARKMLREAGLIRHERKKELTPRGKEKRDEKGDLLPEEAIQTEDPSMESTPQSARSEGSPMSEDQDVPTPTTGDSALPSARRTASNYSEEDKSRLLSLAAQNPKMSISNIVLASGVQIKEYSARKIIKDAGIELGERRGRKKTAEGEASETEAIVPLLSGISQ